jgi:hypothetical protein
MQELKYSQYDLDFTACTCGQQSAEKPPQSLPCRMAGRLLLQLKRKSSDQSKHGPNVLWQT